MVDRFQPLAVTKLAIVAAAFLIAGAGLLLPSCDSDGNFTIAGYRKSAEQFLNTLIPVIEKVRLGENAVSNN